MNPMARIQSGASLIEVLIAILILSFGMLSLGGMLSMGVQLPKLSGYRATAANLASSHIERIRANPEGFSGDNYTAALNETSAWSFTPISVSASNCSFTGTQCTVATLATADINEFRNAVRQQLPAGDMIMKCSTSPGVYATCAKAALGTKTTQGNLWLIWQEPSTFAALDPSSSDQCPSEATSVYTSPKPRCMYVAFTIE